MMQNIMRQSTGGYPFMDLADTYGVSYGVVKRAALAVEKFGDPEYQVRNSQSLAEVMEAIPDASVRQGRFYDDLIAAVEGGMKLWGRLPQ